MRFTLILTMSGETKKKVDSFEIKHRQKYHKYY